ncbi:LysE family translocator [Sphingorhabdus arenilitoris]|uniref:LysE family translocator n=1 Tax=Sphingorhabdus arenilitoris TaxID=1490041 RepID=A0ABV8RHK5_9SPHN
MPPLETILLFFFADLAICLTPGPATIVTAGHAASGGIRGALGPIAGIHVGNFIWYTLSAFGLTALITSAPDIYTALRWGGAAYLLWMGYRMIAHSSNPFIPGAKARNTRFWPGFGSGLAVHMSNPKALLFYASFLPQFIDPKLPVTQQILVFAGITVITESIGLFTYAGLTASARKAAARRFVAFPFDKIAGSVLIGAAIIMVAVNSRF